MAGVRSKRRKTGKYQGYYTNHQGKQTFFEGTRSKAETLRIAQRLEDESRQVRLGYASLRTTSERSFAETKDEYFAWGMSQGGRGGRPWGDDHARKRRERLAWWERCLGIKMVSDLEQSLGKAEAALRELQREGRAGKTIANYIEALAAFCDWCVERSYLNRDPLKNIRSFDTTPQTMRRVMTIDEIQRLLAVSPPYRALLWETALFSGLRANELRHLSRDHLDVDEQGLHLDAAWTKNRKEGFLPLPQALIEKLYAFDEALDRYRRVFKKLPAFLPAAPLLYVPRDPARELDKDLTTAQIPKHTKDGKLDFHALRVTYINLIIESGATVKEAQTLARHATPQMTMNIYGRTRQERLAGAVESIAQYVLCMSPPDSEETQGAENISTYEDCARGFESPLRHFSA